MDEFSGFIKLRRTCCSNIPNWYAINIGDKVHLNSGSPDLIVVDIDPEDNKISCSWIDNNQVLIKEFPRECLHLTEEYVNLRIKE